MRSIVLLMLIFFSSMSRADGWRDFAAQLMMVKQAMSESYFSCRLMIQARYPFARREVLDDRCARASQAFQSVMDCHRIPQNQGLRCFEGELFQLLRQDKTERFLKDLKAQLELRPVGIWSFAQDWFQNSQEALKAIAVLFQDTSHFYHVEDLENLPHLNLLKEVLQLLRAQSDRGIISGMYPNPLVWNASPQYHFFVPAYGAYLLAQMGFNEESVIFPYALNEIYELFMLGVNEYKDDGEDEVPLVKLYFQNFRPRHLTMSKESHVDALKDIYLGYVGSFWGVTLANPGVAPKLMSLSSFFDAFTNRLDGRSLNLFFQPCPYKWNDKFPMRNDAPPALGCH